MLNVDVKRQINSARDVLVGKIPDPKGQIDQITNALIYKFMDDQDRLAQTLPGGKVSFFIDEYSEYAWHKLFDSKLSNQHKSDLYMEGLIKLAKAKHLPDLFRDIFKDAFLPFRAPDTVAMFLEEINKFDYHHSEDLGNAFEYLLSIMGSQGDAGQFRTPRNIIEFIVEAVNPTKEDTILDPACGTAGFLVEAYKYITNKNNLTPNQIQDLANHINGIDIDPGMAKIARVNLYLHGFKTPLISEDDTLTNEKTWGKKYDVILANPPFMTPKGGIKPHDKFSMRSNRAEVLFTDYIAEHLKLAGRAGVVVPEGIIFQSSNAYKQLRKKLIDDNYLWAVVSLPSGVFQPYSGVKTSILLFDRKRAENNSEILFLKIENDGFDLGAQRRQNSDKNDLPLALEAINKWRTGEKIENSNVLYIEKSTIKEDQDYNISLDRYRADIDYSRAKWPLKQLKDLEETGEIEFLRGQGLSKKDLTEQGKYKGIHYGEIYTAYDPLIRNIFSSTNFEGKVRSLKGDVLVPATTTADALGIAVARSLNEDGVVIGGDINIIRTKNKVVLSDYLALLISNPPLKIKLASAAKGANILHLSNSDLRKLKIPLPPIGIQRDIVAELGSYQNIVNGANQIVKNWNPRVEIDPNWPKLKLKKICEYAGGTQPPKATFINHPKKGYIRLLQIRDYKSDENAVYIPMSKRHKTCDEDDIMIGRYGPPVFQILRGKKGAYNVALMKCLPDNSKITNDWLYYFLLSDPVQEKIISVSGRVRQSGVRPSDLDELIISLPSVEIQMKIVKKIEEEKSLIDSSKKIVELYQQKTKEIISNLWSE